MVFIVAFAIADKTTRAALVDLGAMQIIGKAMSTAHHDIMNSIDIFSLCLGILSDTHSVLIAAHPSLLEKCGIGPAATMHALVDLSRHHAQWVPNCNGMGTWMLSVKFAVELLCEPCPGCDHFVDVYCTRYATYIQVLLLRLVQFVQ